MCFSSGARPAGIVIPVCCRIIEYQGKGGNWQTLCLVVVKGSARKKVRARGKLGSVSGTIISVVTWDTTII